MNIITHEVGAHMTGNTASYAALLRLCYHIKEEKMKIVVRM
jgi:hypothetical protein